MVHGGGGGGGAPPNIQRKGPELSLLAQKLRRPVAATEE